MDAELNEILDKIIDAASRQSMLDLRFKSGYDCEGPVNIKHPVIAGMPWPEPFNEETK